MSIREQRRLRFADKLPLERTVMARVREALGLEPDLVLWRNTAGYTEEFDAINASVRPIQYGLAPGASDLIGILKMPGGLGRFFGLELKQPGKRPTKAQLDFAGVVHRHGGFCGWADSVETARAALERARRGALE